VLARPLETCARRCVVPRRCERGQASRPAMAPGCVASLLVIPYATPALSVASGEGLVAGTTRKESHPLARWAATSGSGLWLGPVPSSLS
jgi:hypothetical protein